MYLHGRTNRRGPRKRGHWGTLATTKFVNLLLPNMFRFLDSMHLAQAARATGIARTEELQRDGVRHSFKVARTSLAVSFAIAR